MQPIVISIAIDFVYTHRGNDIDNLQDLGKDDILKNEYMNKVKNNNNNT